MVYASWQTLLLVVRRNKLVKKFYKYLKLSSGFLAFMSCQCSNYIRDSFPLDQISPPPLEIHVAMPSKLKILIQHKVPKNAPEAV